MKPSGSVSPEKFQKSEFEVLVSGKPTFLDLVPGEMADRVERASPRVTRGGAIIGKDENGSGEIDMVLHLSCNTLHLEYALLRMAGVGEPWCVENANLGRMISLHTMFEIPNTHHYAVLARRFVKTR